MDREIIITYWHESATLDCIYYIGDKEALHFLEDFTMQYRNRFVKKEPQVNTIKYLQDSVIIIEDCEQLLQDRGSSPYQINAGFDLETYCKEILALRSCKSVAAIEYEVKKWIDADGLLVK